MSRFNSFADKSQVEMPLAVEGVQNWLVEIYFFVLDVTRATNSNMRVSTEIRGDKIEVRFDRLPLDSSKDAEPIESVTVNDDFSEMVFPSDWYGKNGVFGKRKLKWFDVAGSEGDNHDREGKE